MKKKIILAVIAALLAVLLVCTLVACNKDESPVSPDSSATPETPTAEIRRSQ